MNIGLIVDVETTGLDSKKDVVIEVGLCEISWGDDMVATITRMYSGLQDPGVPLSPEVQQLTGLTSESLTGQSIDWGVVSSMWEKASVVIAHNADFDRSFLSRLPQLSGPAKHWACSVRHIDWYGKGFGTRKLSYLAAEHGFVNSFAHRALFDCATTFRLIKPHLQELIQKSHEPEIKFLATGSPFETKDVLRAAGYRWDPDARVWHKTTTSDKADAERQFLREKVYGGSPRHTEETIWFNAANT